MKTLIFALTVSLIASFICGLVVIPLLKKIKASQTVLKYVENHKDKNGTPTMGGLFFIIPSCVIFFIFSGFSGRTASVAAAIGLAFMLVGFLDDFIKIKFKRNEGLKAYQKIIFQCAIAVLAGVFCYKNSITTFYIPFTKERVDLGIFTVAVVAVIFIAITNSVNLTDGLDGLAGSTSAVYLLFITALIMAQSNLQNFISLKTDEYEKLNLLAVCIVGGILAFLIFNVPKAKVFMGDTGSLSLGGFIGSVSVFSSNSFFIPVIGIMFVISSISVIVQVIYYKRTRKRVFLMAPIHHHFQLKGYTETQISYCYSIITAIFGALSLISYL